MQAGNPLRQETGTIANSPPMRNPDGLDPWRIADCERLDFPTGLEFQARGSPKYYGQV